MNTKSCFDWAGCLLRFTSDGRRKKFFVIVVGQDGLFQPVNILYQMSNSTPVQSFKINCLFSPSSSLPLFFFIIYFIAVHFSERMKRNFWEKIPQAFHKDTVIYHRGSSGNTILTYKNKPAKDHSLIPASGMSLFKMSACITL